MKKILILVAVLSLVACRKGGSASPASAPVPPTTPSGPSYTYTPYQFTLSANITKFGASHPETATITITSIYTIPQATEVTVVSNAEEAFGATLNIGAGVTCYYSKTAGETTFSSRTCNSYSNVSLAPGDQVTFSVTGVVGKTSNASVTSNLNSVQ